MDFDTAKENIQPLRQGRNVARLGIALSAESHELLQKELIEQRKEYELEIQNYKGEDPLELWYEYISWIEQSYPKSGKESHLDDVLIKCISEFENAEKYRQDRRMIKIYMKYIDNQPDPQNFYQELYNQGIGTMVADLYIGWAYYYDAADNFKKTEEIFQKGLRARAQPLEDLENAHVHFGFSMSQRMLYKDEPNNQELFRNSLEERRTALTSLRTHKKRHVGTTRTGSAIKRERPGPVLQENAAVGGGNNVGIQVFKEEDDNTSSVPKNESIVKSLVDSLRTRENTCEPGPWNKARLGHKNGPLISENQELGFKIAEDDSTSAPIPYTIKTFHLGFQRPAKFVAKNRPQNDNWDTVPLVIPETLDPKVIPMYSKPFCYPGNGKEYSTEEYIGYKWFKTRGISNKFTLQYDPIWDDAYECGIRIPPNFACKNVKQDNHMEYLVPMQVDAEKGFAVNYEALKTVDSATGRVSDISHEENMAEKWRMNPRRYTGEMDMETDDLEETVIGERRASIMPRFSLMPGRQSILPERKSLFATNAPENLERNSLVFPRPSMENKTSEFKTPHVPGVNRKSILPKKSMLPPASNLSPIKDTSGLSESQNESSSEKQTIPPSQFEIFTDEKPTHFGAIRKDSLLLKRKIDTPDKSTSNKNVCAIDTPEKFSSPPHINPKEEEPTQFGGFAVPKLPSPNKQKPFQIFEDDQCTEKMENKGIFANSNDSMCTMNFNRCIETGSMSTPIKIKEKKLTEKKEIQMPESPDENLVQNISPITPVIDQENIDVAQGFMAKQLSTIMETTETTSSTGVNTKSTIGSPESDVEVRIQENVSVIKQNVEEVRVIPESSMAPPPTFSIFEDKTENMKPISVKVAENSMAPPPTFSIFEEKTENLKAVSLQAPSFNFAEESSKITPAPVPAFSIFEDKTENMKAVSLHMPSFHVENITEIVNKENMSRVIENLPIQESVRVSNDSAFPAYDDDVASVPQKMSFKEPIQDMSVGMKRLSIQQEIQIPKDNSVIKTSILIEQSLKGDALENASLAAIVEEKEADSQKSLMSPPLIKKSENKRTSDDFLNSFYASPVQSQQKKSILGLTSNKNADKTQNISNFTENQIPAAETANSVKKLISFEVFKDDESQKGSNVAPAKRTSTDFYEFFGKSPPKPGKSLNEVELARKSPDISSLLKFDTSTNTRDTTQSLIKMNLNDIGNPSSNSMIHVSQIKQEKSLHITDRLSTFAKPKTPQMSPELPQFKKPFFAEDDNINTMNFASNLGSVQNSTFIAPPEPDAPIFGIMKVEGGIRMSGQVTEEKSKIISEKLDLSIDLDEDEFIRLENETEKKEPVVEMKENEIKSKIPLPMSKRSIVVTKKSLAPPKISVDPPAEDLGVSIYIPEQTHSMNLEDEHWDEVNDDFNLHSTENQYLPSMIDLDGTRAFIHDQLLEEIVNPFDKDLITALLAQIDFINYLRDLPSCSLKNKIGQLAKGQTVEFGNESFDIFKAIGKGAYGTVFTGKCRSNGKIMALKQERPANLWEYYICLEIRSRIANPSVLCGFMSVDYALIGTNASVLVSEFSKYGTLIDVCNKIKKITNRNMDEYIVMHLMSQILDLMDHLHSSLIIHADIKPDNFLVMRKINPENLSQPTIQLIDFGVAIDMQLLNNMHPHREVQFKLVADEDPCVEMRENKPWTYQVDLYGVAGIAHALLFGRYMEVQQKLKWEIKTKIPRYFQKDIWEMFFDKLLNIRSCKEMPNLQELRALLKEELQLKDKIFREKIHEFNNILLSS